MDPDTSSESSTNTSFDIIPLYVAAVAVYVASLAVILTSSRSGIRLDPSTIPLPPSNLFAPVRNEHKPAPRALSPAQKTKLNAIDKGRCLITAEKNPATVEPCHIIRRKADDYARMWRLAQLDIDAPQNLVSLRADWRASYDRGCWAFVPALSVLEKMDAYAPFGSFQKPYSSFRKNTEYVFVALPTLEPDLHSDLAAFKHHAHPYFAIANALPKLKAHLHRLTPPQRLLLQAMQKIHDRWLPARPGKRRRDSADEGTAPSARKKALHTRTHTTQNADTGQLALASPPPLDGADALHYNGKESILAWVEGVAAALQKA